jgi:ABC-type Zn uptake system ZnuABC Zn-binding protein ZnuA
MKKQLEIFVVFSSVSMLLFIATACTLSSVTATPEKVGHEVEREHEMPALSPVSLGVGEKLKVVATTNIVGDVVVNIGGEQINLTVLMPPGVDPHTFEPTPQDVVAVSDAHVLFVNGAGLEEFLGPLLESAGAENKTVSVSQGVELLGGEDGQHEHSVDPHTWTNPNNVIVWVRNVESALIALDPSNAGEYQVNAEAYQIKLQELDAWVREQVAQIPQADRQIVTDHQLFAYLSDEYGFTQIGTIVPGYSTVAEPSAKDLAELEDAIRELGVRAIFVGNTVNPDLARRVAEDTGTRLVFLYTGSLTAKGGDADNYVDYVRFNVNAIVNALQGDQG